jgi:hypothetical protein
MLKIIDPPDAQFFVNILCFFTIIIIAPQALQIHHRSSPGGVWAKGELVWTTCDLAQRPEARGQITGCPHVLATARNSRFVHTETGYRDFI